MKKILLILLPVVLIGLAAAYFIYNKPHKDIQGSDADLQMTATELYQDFDTDEAAANTSYLDKLIAVTGQIKEVTNDDEGTSVHLETEGGMFGVICQLDPLSEHKRTDFAVGETVTLKGICTGMLMDVVLVRCVEV